MSADRALLESIAQAVTPGGAAIAHLGTGGFASTFKVSTPEGVFALKVIDPTISDAKRVDRELSALQAVDHDGVVKIRDFGVHEQGGVHYRWIRMDFVDGTSLRTALAGGQVFTPAEAVDLLHQLVSAAAAIWDAGTAHRDLSPGNIMITPEGRAIIVDLGMARHVDDETLTALPTPGTPGWMSPEQVGSSPTHGDRRSDQFVLGAIGYLLLTGVMPFTGSNLMDRWVAPAVLMPRSIRAIDPSLPMAVADVVERMLQKQPHRRYLKVWELLADLEAAAETLVGSTPASESSPKFYVNIGFVKNWAEQGFLSVLSAGGSIIDLQAGGRTREFVDATRSAASLVVTDPVTSFARSPIAFRPAAYQRLPYGRGPVLTGFPDDASRATWCQSVWDASTEAGPDVVISPYFYAGEGEQSWIRESLACARVFEDLAGGEGTSPAVWTGILLHQSWLADEASRDHLLTDLTGQEMDGLHVLTHTAQPSFAPLSDLSVIRGFRDLFETMHDADVPVVVGRRASSGLLLLALGADGWSTGIHGNQMNGAPHPEADVDGGRPSDRIYVPQLLNLITLTTFAAMRAANPGAVALDTPQAAQLLATNPDLESLSTGQRILLLQHNLVAMNNQTNELGAMPTGQRISSMRSWVASAASTYRALPPTRVESEGAGFLAVWEAALS
jgi:hypothetical protein